MISTILWRSYFGVHCSISLAAESSSVSGQLSAEEGEGEGGRECVCVRVCCVCVCERKRERWVL